ncbi:MAG TPA: sodium:solute symporter [Caldithrix abyssi]|uniref:Sodium:solute symporter n=1 Tax=Caldithrix abyssi TaxID=187145 RepID=A0A7V4U192_CALAY|nr:sodium:solute symporter [Caldithrix abyssi]
MGITIVDVVIIVVYLIVVAIIGSFSGGKQKSTKDYFLGGKSVPWWAVSFSIVAAETSSLTFISVPGLAYLANLNFLQVTFGYLLGRIVIAFLFLPAYKKGDLVTAYAFLEERFGFKTRRFASTVFLFTRIAADGVRLFATAIPLAVIFRTSSYFATMSDFDIYLISIVIIALVSFFYTYTGGVKGIIWADVLQMTIYVGGALLALFVLIGKMPADFSLDSLGDKLQLFNLSGGGSLPGFFREPYTLVGSLLGGMFLSMASHGTDQLIVQRLLTTRNLRDSQKAIITSGLIVIFQFALFLGVGLLLYKFYNGIALTDPQAPFHKPDEIFPYFIIHALPAGLKGLIVAGLFAAAMSTLAGSMSSLSGSAMFDLYKPLTGKDISPQKELLVSRIFTVIAGLILVLVAFLFIELAQSVVEIALGIASITYGGLLGTFLLGLLSKKVNEKSAILGFSAGILSMLAVSLVPILVNQPPLIHWTWYVLLGSGITVAVGSLFKFSAHE